MFPMLWDELGLELHNRIFDASPWQVLDLSLWNGRCSVIEPSIVATSITHVLRYRIVPLAPHIGRVRVMILGVGARAGLTRPLSRRVSCDQACLGRTIRITSLWDGATDWITGICIMNLKLLLRIFLWNRCTCDLLSSMVSFIAAHNFHMTIDIVYQLLHLSILVVILTTIRR